MYRIYVYMGLPGGTFKKSVAALISAALVVTAPGPGCWEALAQEMRGDAAAASIGTNGAAGAAVLQLAGFGVPLLVTGDSLAVPLGGVLQGVGPGLKPVRGLDGTRTRRDYGSGERPAPLGSMRAADPKESPADDDTARTATQPSLETLESAGTAKEWGERSFSALRGEELIETGEGEPQASPPAVLGTPSGVRKGIRLGRSGSIAKRLSVFVAPLGLVALSQVQPQLAPFRHAVGQAGYAVGNALAFLFTLPQIYQTFKDGGAQAVPAWRAAVGIAASLALGLVNATVLGSAFWGIQNVFGAVTLAAPLVLGAWLSRKGKPLTQAYIPSSAKAKLGPIRSFLRRIRSDPALHKTALTAAIAAGLSVAIYYAAAAVIPGLLAAALPAATVCAITLAIQAVTGGMFTLLFLPDVIQVLRGKAPKSFTSSFSLLFFLTSVGFIAWGAQSYAVADAARKNQYLVIAALNMGHAAVAMFSYVFARRHERKDKPLPRSPAPPPQLPQPPPAPAPARDGPRPLHLHEDIFGFRGVRGLRRDPTLGSLPPDADARRVQEQISRQFGVSMPRLIALAADYHLPLDGRREAWLSVYDRLQRANRSEFQQIDHGKHRDGVLAEAFSRLLGKKPREASFRRLAGRAYPPGWPGLLVRALEVHKQLLGLFVRFPYHIFDSFVFGYFRRNISFEFAHSTEDFFAVAEARRRAEAREKGEPLTSADDKPLAERWLEASMSVRSFRGSRLTDQINAHPLARTLRRWVWSPLAEPLYQFITRRFAMAVMGALAMGLISPLAPFAFMSFSLTALPLLGPALVAAAHGVPMLAAAVPFIGPALADALGAAANALVADLVVGPLLNTLVLSTLLTFPAAFKSRVMDRPGGALNAPPVLSRRFLREVGRTAGSWTFWKRNLASLGGLMTVGAEIEGIMTYAGAIDGFFDPAWRGLTGREFRLFHAIGAAVERPASAADPRERSPIPFGGAVTWGNALLYKLQDALGFNLTDFVARHVNGLIDAVAPNARTRGMQLLGASAGASAVFQDASAREAEADLGFRRSADSAEMKARLEAAVRQSGNLREEIARVRANIAALEARLTGQERDLAELQARSKPVSPEERAEYERLLRELSSKRDEAYLSSKLAQSRDLGQPLPEEAQRLVELKRLQDLYSAVLLPPGEAPGYQDSLAGRVASLKSVQDMLRRHLDGSHARQADLGAAYASGEAGWETIETLVAEIEELRLAAKAELSTRDATERLLAVLNGSRNAALRERRGGKEMLEFHKNLSRLATVMDLAFSLDKIASAQNAIRGMQALLDRKSQKIEDAKEKNAEGLTQARKSQQQIEQWKADSRKTLDEDDSWKAEMVKSEGRTAQAVGRIGSFRGDVKALLARLDAEEGGAGGSARAEYQRRKDLLPALARWKTDGKPGDPDYRSLKGLQQKLKDADDIVRRIDDGMAKFNGASDEFAGLMVLAIPGEPAVGVTNPSQAQTLQILADRKIYWQQKLANYQKQLDEATRRLDPGYGGTETDDFGDSNPVSLQRWLDREQQTIRRSQDELRDYAPRVDRLASSIQQAVPGASLPPLSGLDLKELQAAIEGYADKLSAVSFPAETEANEDALFAAKMDLLSLGKLLPYAGRSVIRWSKADAAAAAIQKAMTETSPPVKNSLAEVVAAVRRLLADIDADVAYVQAGLHDGIEHQAERLALIDRKRDLLTRLRGVADGARGMLRDQLIPFQEDAIQAVDPGGDKYARLFDSQIKLYDAVQKAVDRVLPWALASQGAKDGDVGAALANIQAGRQKYRKFIDGYDDSKGVHHKGIDEYKMEVANRKNPGYAGTEILYGETMPVSLPRKIAQYGAEKAQRAGEINLQYGEINQILAQIDGLTADRFNLRAQYAFPTNIDGTSQASKDALQAIVDARKMQDLGNLLTRIGEEYKAKAGEVKLDDDADGGVATGNQPPVTLDVYNQVALLVLQAGRRLVPTSLQDPQGAAASYAVARYLFSHAVVDSSREWLNERIPQAEAFLAQGDEALQWALADLPKSESSVKSNGTAEGADAVVDRSIAVYGKLNALASAGMAFFGLKRTWDQDAFDAIDEVETYYDAVAEIYQKGASASDKETQALQKMRDALRKTYDEIDASRAKLTRWLSQLNSKDESALARIGEDLRQLQEKTRVVLEANVQYREIEAQHRRAGEIADWSIRRIDGKQRELQRVLDGLSDPRALPPDLARRIGALSARGGSWLLDPDSSDAAQALVVRKADFAFFLEQLFGTLGVTGNASSGRNLALLQRRILDDPRGLAELLPNSKVLEFGDDADGFYIVYQTRLSVPHGLETSSWVTFGNLASLWGNNVSVAGYQFVSPLNDENAPWGDKGVEIQVESLQGGRWVNYLNVDLHRFVNDYPPDARAASSARRSRLMVFDDFALLLFGDRLYLALTGFGDWALGDPAGKPSYYGGSFKTSVKFTEVMRLNAEQQNVFAKDPRRFMKDVNLDFTGFDPDLNKTFHVRAEGENKRYLRRQLGPSLDLARLLESENAFTLDFYFARQEGTDDYDQNSLGVSVLKGFSIRDDSGKPWMILSNRATGERGPKQNMLSDHASVALPGQGVAFSAEGRLLGGARNYFAEADKKLGGHGSISAGYGSRYAGMEERLTLSFNTAFTLGELWRAVARNSARALAGGESLKVYDQGLDDFFNAAAPRSQTVAELKNVYLQDIGRKLRTQEIGSLAREIEELRRAGALTDNVRTRGMIGYISNPISGSRSDRIIGGGPAAATFTELALTKTQKDKIESRAQRLYREALRLEARMLELTQAWQAAVVEAAEAGWEVRLANFERLNAPTETGRKEGETRLAKGQARYHQAVIGYNMLAGRDPSSTPPFESLNVEDLKALVAEIRKTLASPERLSEIFSRLDPSEMKVRVGEDPFNIADWLPFIDRLAFSVGAQFQDLLANQVLGAGASIRLPIYDPASKESDRSYRLDAAATIQEMEGVYREHALKAFQEAAEAAYWRNTADALAPRAPQSATELSDAIQAYRNGLTTERVLREAFARWRWYVAGVLKAEGRGALAEAWARQYAGDMPDPGEETPLRLRSIADAFAMVSANSRGLAELARREEAAAHLTQANAHRIQKAYLDIYAGVNLTAGGVGWLPAFGITGIPVYPVFGFEIKPEELTKLQVLQGREETAVHRRLRDKFEANLAVQFFNNVAVLKTGAEARRTLEEGVLPGLRAVVLRARSGGDREGLARALYDLHRAEDRGSRLALDAYQAYQAINQLLGRAPEAPLELDVSLEDALQDLQRVLAAKAPVAAEKAILDSWVSVARAVETRADKGLKVEDLKLEPVSLIVRSLGRLIAALSSEGSGNPELVAAARIQTLEAERAREGYDADLTSRRAAAASGLESARRRLAGLAGRTDPASAVERIEWRRRALLSEAALAALGGSEGFATPEEGRLPLSFTELGERVRSAYEALPAGEEAPPRSFEPESSTRRPAGYARYFYARQDLVKSPIDEHFAEGWVEARLRSRDTPAEALLALSKLQTERAERLRSNGIQEARAQGSVLVSQFEANVRLLRWAEGAERGGGFQQELIERLTAQKERIAALLRLPPTVALGDLTRLVPADPQGTEGGPARIADRFIAEIDALQLDRLRRDIFDGGIPEGFGGEDGLIGRLRADVIADRMSYHGFTPAAAFGLLRGGFAAGGFLEAPDPRAIEAVLANALSESLREELAGQGRMKELALQLQLLMRGVQDKARLVSAQQGLIASAADDYRAALERCEKGGLPAADLLSAQQALADAYADFGKTAGELRGDFITLVAELQALGYGGRLPRGPTPLRGAVGRPEDSAPADVLARHISLRLRDGAFAERLDTALSRVEGLDPGLRKALRLAADVYRLMDQDARDVRHMDFDGPKKLKLLVMADVEGRRLKVEALLKPLVAALRGASGAPAEILQLIREDISSQIGAAEADRLGEEKLLRALRDAWWHGAKAPEEVEGAFQRLEVLHQRMLSERQALLEDYMLEVLSPAEFVMRDVALDRYLKGQQAFDAELVRTFQSAPVQGSVSMARRLDGLYDFRAALERQKDLVRFGRAMAAIDALVMLQEGRLAAQRYERALPAQLRETALALERLKALKEKWRSDKEHGLAPLYAVTEVDGEGRRLWTLSGWYTAAEVERMIRSGRIQVDGQARMWLADGKKRFEVFSGVDVALSRRDSAASAALDNARTRDLFKVLSEQPFALVGLDGQVRRGLDYDAMMKLGDEGRLFYFSRTKDPRTGFHPALHPLQVLWGDPADAEIIAYLGSGRPARDMFPTRQSLDDYIRRERDGGFLRLEAGEKGVTEMLSKSKERRLKSLRAGWLHLKLNTYGFALDPRGLAAAYLTQEEFDAAVGALRGAPKALEDATARLKKREAEAVRAEPEAAARRKEADEETLRYQAVEAGLRRSIEAEVRRGAGLPLEGPLAPAAAARVKAETGARLVKDKEFQAAQKALDERIQAYHKANERLVDARRKADMARSDIQAAETLIANSKTWRLFVTRDMTLSVDADRRLVGVEARAAYGSAGLRTDLGISAGAVTRVTGEVYAALMGKDMRLARLYVDKDLVEKEGRTWILEEVNGRRWAAGGGIAPNFRLLHYVEPQTGLPVLLNRRFLIERLADAGKRLTRSKNWGVMPWNWGNILLELPRAAVHTPIELLAGQDPNQQGYLGRQYMYKTEGGATEHHGFFRKVLGALDVLDIFPDPVERFYDPSQFPAEVRVAPVRPGENILGKDARAGDKDIHFGVGAARRAVAYGTQDLLNARQRVFSYFEGGVTQTLLETRRGHAGRFQLSSVREDSGPKAILDALGDPRVANDPNSDGRGTVEVAGDPRHIEVDRVVKRVVVRPGARQEALAERNLGGYLAVLESRRRQADESSGRLAEEAGRTKQGFQDALDRRRDVSEAERRLSEQTHRLAWRIGAQEALEAEIRALQAEIEFFKRRIAFEKEYLRRLEDMARTSWYFWFLLGTALAALLWELLRRRYPFALL